VTNRFCFPGQVPGPTAGPLITTLTVTFTQPAVQGTVTATFTSTATFFPGDSQHVEIVGGGDYTVHSVVDTTHAVLTNTGLTGNAAPASTVFAPASVVVVQVVSVVGQTSGGGSTVTQGPAAALAGAWPVEQTDGTNILGTASHPTRVDPTGITAQPITATSLPLPTGAAQDSTLIARLGTLGQKTSAGSAPVILASDQPAIPVTANVGTTGGLALDATVTARLNTLGQKTSANSAPVVLASDQSTIPIAGAVTVMGTPAVSVSNFPATQAVSIAAAITANVGTTGGLALDATLTGGTQKTQVVDGAGNVSPAGDTVARARFVKPTDGTNVPAVKAASTAPVLTDPAMVVAQSPVPVGSWYSSLGVVSGVTKASAGNLKSIHGVNRSTTVTLLYLQFFNQTTTPSGSPTVFAEFPVPSLGQAVFGTDLFGANGIPFTTGIAWGWSTTTGTYTVYGTAADVSTQATYL
jgi:hypothetical protein